MATLAERAARRMSADDRFFLISAILMCAVVYGGFSFQLAMGRSSFAVPPLVHAHAIVFMGWVTIYLLQAALATVGPMRWHRLLGWFAAAWMVPMIVLGPWLTIERVQAGRVAFFFEPQHFLIANPLGVLTFAGLTIAAIVLRHRSDWHRRLHMCGMAALLGPGFGRLLPMPFMVPIAFQSAVIAGLIFPVAGIVYDLRKRGRVHPAWWWGVGAIVGTLVLAEVTARSPVGDALYRAVTAGMPGADVTPMAFGKPPWG